MAVKLYWCRGAGRKNPAKQNFGDYLSPLILERCNGVKVEYAPIKKAECISIGSILIRLYKLRKYPFPKSITVWGSGAGVPDLRYPGHHDYAAVRGKKTLELLDCKEKSNIALGDPGLLSDQLYKLCRVSKSKRIGLIPHYVDMNSPEVDYTCSKLTNVKVLSVYSDIPTLFQEIMNCDLILSSSMHGLIVSDSLGVPNAWLKLSAKLDSDFKFYDYYSVFEELPEIMPLSIGQLSDDLCQNIIDEYCRPNIDKIKEKLFLSVPF